MAVRSIPSFKMERGVSYLKYIKYRLFLRKLDKAIARVKIKSDKNSLYIYSGSDLDYRNFVTVNIGMRAKISNYLRSKGYVVYRYNGSPQRDHEDVCLVIKWE